MKQNSIYLMVFIIFLTACHTTKTDSQKSLTSQKYKAIAVEKYGNNIEYILNSPKTYVVCLKRNKPTPQIPQNQISFFIYDLDKEEIIFEDSSIDAKVEWKNDNQVLVKITPGIITGDESEDDFIYVYDVKLREKIK